MPDTIYFYPENQAAYRYLLIALSDLMDREGLSFHIARPGESILAADGTSAVKTILKGGNEA